MKRGEKGDLVLCISKTERIGRAGSKYYVPEITDVGEVQEDFDHTSSSMYILVKVKMRSTGEVRNVDNTNLQLVLSPDDWPYRLSKEENLLRDKPCKG